MDGDDGKQLGGIILACCNNGGDWAEDFVYENSFWPNKMKLLELRDFAAFGLGAWGNDWLVLCIVGWYDA